MYEITNSGRLFDNELLIESGFIQYQCQMSIYYKYSPYGTKQIMLSYVYYCVYRYTCEVPVKMVCVHSSKEIPCELLGIFTLVYVNQDFMDEGPFHFSILG